MLLQADMHQLLIRLLQREIGTVVLGANVDVSGTDSPYRVSNITVAPVDRYGDSKRHWRQFRGATWVSIHNGGGVGWGG
jgi:urocanate hydratase